MPAYFAPADCLISLRPSNHNLPLKIFDYMAAGKPIVATRGQRIAESARRYAQRQFGWRSFLNLAEGVYGRVLHDGTEARALS